MKTDKEWEARARELIALEARKRSSMDATEYGSPGFEIRAMLQLGREMADEAMHQERRVWVECDVAQRAADARAEEIARRLEEGGYLGCAGAAKIARSTITKPKEPETFTVKLKNVGNLFSVLEPDEAAIRADERRLVTKEILDRLLADGSGLGWSLKMTGGQPKTREWVLWEALQRIAYGQLTSPDVIAREALEWKP